jgi:hypothetical protein
MVNVAQKASMQVKSLIESINADDELLQKLEEANFISQLQGNVSFHNQSIALLNQAEDNLAHVDYDAAIINAQEALQIIRQVFKSINRILLDTDLITITAVDASSLLDSVIRTLDRSAYLRTLLLSNATNQLAMLDRVNALLNLEDMESLIFEDKTNLMGSNLRQANDLITQVYNYLKIQARIYNYLEEMEQARVTLRGRIRYEESIGIDLNGIFESCGYENETEFMNALQNMTQDAKPHIGNLKDAMSNLETLGQMVQQMDQTVTQEMNRYQWQHSSGSNNDGRSGPENSVNPSGSTIIGSSTNAGGPSSGNSGK